MSRPVRVAFVMEGPTDFVVLRAAVRSLLNGRDFEPTTVYPEMDETLRPTTRGGWGGVYRWCRQAVDQAGGPARGNPIFQTSDMVIVQVDADVARKRYSDAKIHDAPNNDLPCERPCPPPSATTDALRAVVLGWMNETAAPPRAVLCTPSKSLETWVLVGLFPDNRLALMAAVECRWGAEVQLRRYGLVRGDQKLIDEYRAREGAIQAAWPAVRARCSEAERFSTDVLHLVPVD